MKIDAIRNLIDEVGDIRYYLQFDNDIDNVRSLETYYRKMYKPQANV